MTDHTTAPTPADRPSWMNELFAKLDAFANRLNGIERATAANIQREFFTVPQAAARLPYKPWTLRQACNTGRISAAKPDGRGWRIPLAEIERVEREGLSSDAS